MDSAGANTALPTAISRSRLSQPVGTAEADETFPGLASYLTGGSGWHFSNSSVLLWMA
jgi:hypothetical protein